MGSNLISIFIESLFRDSQFDMYIVCDWTVEWWQRTSDLMGGFYWNSTILIAKFIRKTKYEGKN